MSPAERIPGAIQPGHWFPQAWALALSQVAEALDLGGRAEPLEVSVTAADPASWKAWPTPLWYAQTWTLPRPAQLWVGCPTTVPYALWKHIGGDADAGAEALDTFREALHQAASEAATAAGERLGITPELSALEPASPPVSGWAVALRFQTGGEDCTIVLGGNVALANALGPAAAPPVRVSKSLGPVPREEPPADPFEMIREVSLELAVSFGETTMRLADVLKLSSGAIIELNRSVSDPVELLVNDSVIARGDVVVVEGNYGVRITEIVSRRERMRSVL